MSTLYDTTATLFLATLDSTWASEETMAAAWAGAPFGTAVVLDRTKHADALIRYLFHQSWRSAWVSAHDGATAQQAVRPVAVDLLQVAIRLINLTEDYNLLSQVLPNLVPHSFLLDRDGLQKDLFALEALFDGGLSGKPAAKGKKAVKATLDPSWDAQKQVMFTQGQALSKTAAAFAKFTPPSWRITPFGRTPALTDSANVSGLPAAADPYIHVLPWIDPLGEPLKTAYVTWDTGAQSVSVRPSTEPGDFRVGDLPGDRSLFHSDSGGTMLGSVMLSRGLAYDAWLFWAETCALRALGKTIPSFYALAKLSSLRLVGSASFMDELELDLHVTNYQGRVPGFTWSWDKRAPIQPAVHPAEAPLQPDTLVWADDL